MIVLCSLTRGGSAVRRVAEVFCEREDGVAESTGYRRGSRLPRAHGPRSSFRNWTGCLLPPVPARQNPLRRSWSCPPFPEVCRHR